jgi:hypothetical protein
MGKENQMIGMKAITHIEEKKFPLLKFDRPLSVMTSRRGARVVNVVFPT